MIIKCDCNNVGQDKIHGKNHRVHNARARSGNNPPTYRCTVCGKEKKG